MSRTYRRAGQIRLKSSRCLSPSSGWSRHMRRMFLFCTALAVASCDGTSEGDEAANSSAGTAVFYAGKQNDPSDDRVLKRVDASEFFDAQTASNLVLIDSADDEVVVFNAARQYQLNGRQLRIRAPFLQ